jgi:hypothetical protein
MRKWLMLAPVRRLCASTCHHRPSAAFHSDVEAVPAIPLSAAYSREDAAAACRACQHRTGPGTRNGNSRLAEVGPGQLGQTRRTVKYGKGDLRVLDRRKGPQ